MRLRRVASDGWSVSGGPYTQLWLEIRALGRGGRLRYGFLIPTGILAPSRSSPARWKRRVGTVFSTGTASVSGTWNVRSVGGDVWDGHAHERVRMGPC